MKKNLPFIKGILIFFFEAALQELNGKKTIFWTHVQSNYRTTYLLMNISLIILCLEVVGEPL